jgi:hypothetical protein
LQPNLPFQNNLQSSPYDNSSSAHAGPGIFQQQNGRNTFYVSDTQRQKQNLFKDINVNKDHPQMNPVGPNGARM